jgi:hypothetical protein
VSNGRLFYGSGSGNDVKEFGVTSSYALNALSASFAQTASFAPAYLPLTGGTINGNLVVNGTASIAFLNVTYESASVIYSSGSNQFGDASNDTQTLWGTVDVKTGPVLVTGSLNVSGGITGSLLGTASYANQALSSSYALTASFITASGVYGPYGSNSVISASHAVNGGVTQLLAGSNITLSPTTGKGQVTISSTGGGGPFFNTATGSYGSFYDTTIQINPVGNIARSMSFNTTDITNGVSISGSTSPFNTYIKTENPGVYNIQFSAQVEKTDSGTDEIVIWLRKNGIDLTDTATTITLSGNNDKQVAAWNWFVTSAANDYYQIIWISADTGMRLLAETISGTHPGIPSVILTANRVDQFLSNTGSFSGSFTGVFTGSLQGTSSWANNAITASYALQALSASFASTVPASGVIGLNLSQIATASFTASVSPTQFTVTSGSSTELVVNGTGVTIGNAITDTHRVTGSLNMSGSLDVNGTGIYRNVLTIQKTGNTQGILLQANAAGDFYSPHIQFKGSSGVLNTISLDYNNLVISSATNNYVGFGQVGQAGEYAITINPYAYGVNAAPNNFVQRITQTANNAVGLVIKNSTAQSPTPTGNFLEFRNASNTVLSAITSGGSFLIGTSTTSSLRLDVSGSARIQGDTTISGSFTVFTGSAVEFQVTNTGVKIGNAITDTHTVTGSLNISGSTTATSFTGSLQGTASFAISSSRAVSSSFATTASFATTSKLTNNAYFAQGILGGDQLIPTGVDEPIQFIDQFDPQGWWDDSTYQFLPTIEGYYRVSLGVWWENPNDSTVQLNAQIRSNGSTQEMILQQPATTVSGISLFGTKIIYFNGSSDYIEFTVFQGTASSIKIQQGSGAGSGTWFSAEYMTM